MSVLLAIDPGKDKIGCALFLDGKLERAVLVRTDNLFEKEIPGPCSRWAKIAGLIQSAIPTGDAFYNGSGRLVVELMQVDNRTGRAQANALLELTGITGAIIGRLASAGYTSDLIVGGHAPKHWGKGRSKEANHLRMWKRLDDDERNALLFADMVGAGQRRSLMGALRPKIESQRLLEARIREGDVGMAEHVLDAVCIGLFDLDRFGRTR